MRLKSPLILFIILSAVAILSGCRRVNNVVWSKYVSLPEDGWDPVNVIPFFPWPEDSIANPGDRYSLILSVRFSPINRPSKLHLVMRQDSDEGGESSDTLAVDLLPPQSTPVGRGTYAVYETVDTLLRGIDLKPGYCVELQSLSMTDNTKGIIDIGMILEVDNDKESSFIERIQNFKL